MNEYSIKYRKIAKDLIDRSFPTLREKTIFVGEFKLFNFYYHAIVTTFLFFSLVGIHPKCRGDDKSQIQSLLAHEFAHLEIIYNKNFFQLIIFAFRWLFFKKWKFWFERQCDSIAIERGYGKGLFKAVKENDKKRTKELIKMRLSQGYLSAEEIKKQMKLLKR